MKISVEISYYPLCEYHDLVIDEFIEEITMKDIFIEIGAMSSVITGDYYEIMGVLTKTLYDFMEKYPSVFHIKMSNSCPL